MTPIRSFLFAPGDSEKKMGKALSGPADAVILDLEDSVLPDQKPVARILVAQALALASSAQKWVRVNPLDTGHLDADLAVCQPNLPDGIVLPKAQGPADIATLSQALDVFDPDQNIKILPIVTETAAAPLRLSEYADAHLPRLWGMTWGAEDLATDIGASANKDAGGEFFPVFQMVRSLCLLAARAAGVEPIDTLHADFRDSGGLAVTSAQSRIEGFTGRLAIHPAQVDVINENYMPTADEIAHAQKVIEAFEHAPGAGAVAVGGKMVDIPHLNQAKRILAAATAFGVD